jgi:MFS family permease
MPEQGRSQRSEEESSPGVSLWRRVAPVAAVTFFAALAFYVVLIQLPFLLADRGMTEPADAALGVAAAAIAAPLGALLFRRLGRRSVAAKLALSFAFSAAGLATIVGVAAFPLILVGAAINGIGSGMALPKLMTWAMAGSRLEERGRVAGLWNGCFFLGQFMSPLAFMAIAAASGQRAGGFVVFASLTGASAVAAALVSRIALRRAAPAAALVRPESNA